MEDAQIQKLAQAIADQTVLPDWRYWLILGLIVAVVGAAASYFGSYFSKRGEFKAAKTDRDEILAQLKENTKTTARINSIVSLGEWSERERRTLRRVKLEELMVTAHKARDWMYREQNRLFFSSDDQETVSPLPLMSTLGKLFFPELRMQIFAFDNACDALRLFYMQSMQELIAAKIEAISVASFGSPPGWEQVAEVRTGQAQIAVRERLNDKFQEGNRKMSVALMELDEAAAAVMAEIIAVPPDAN
jgi:hypothetical protein